MDDTIGQWMAGSDTSVSNQLGYGFWAGAGEDNYAICLPLVLSNL